MVTPERALRHSPALWGLVAACVGEVVAVVVWNVWQRARDAKPAGRLRDRLRI